MADLPSIKTDRSLLDKLEKAATSKQTPEQRLEQRVSYIYGSINADGGVTHEQIRETLKKQEGGY